jgi:hypothetical protein
MKVPTPLASLEKLPGASDTATEPQDNAVAPEQKQPAESSWGRRLVGG